MSAQVHILVEFEDGKPSLALGPTPQSRSYTRKGTAEAYAKGITDRVISRNAHWQGSAAAVAEADPQRSAMFLSYVEPVPDIRVLSVQIPDDGPVGDGMWPNLLGVPAVSWS